jgi:hypothetical protein
MTLDRRTRRYAPDGHPSGDAPTSVSADTGRFPLTVVVVDDEGLISHWSRGAHHLFGASREEAVGLPAADLLPLSGVLLPGGARELDHTTTVACRTVPEGRGADLDPFREGGRSWPSSGRARLGTPGQGRVDVLWWAYPLTGPGRARLAVLATDAARLRRARVAPGFAQDPEVRAAENLARRIPELLPGMSRPESSRIVSRMIDLGCPVLDFGGGLSVAVTPDRGGAGQARQSGGAGRVEWFELSLPGR